MFCVRSVFLVAVAVACLSLAGVSVAEEYDTFGGSTAFGFSILINTAFLDVTIATDARIVNETSRFLAIPASAINATRRSYDSPTLTVWLTITLNTLDEGRLAAVQLQNAVINKELPSNPYVVMSECIKVNVPPKITSSSKHGGGGIGTSGIIAIAVCAGVVVVVAICVPLVIFIIKSKKPPSALSANDVEVPVYAPD